MDAPICQGCVEKEARIADLERRVAEQGLRIRQLEELVRKLLGQLPPPPEPATRPMADIPKPEPKKPSGRKPGGQPRHPPHLKKLLPIERVTAVVAHVPKHCESCHANLPPEATATDPPPSRHQIAELPNIRAEITEHQGHYRSCPDCQHVTQAPIPAEVRAESIGPKLAAAMSYMVGVHHVSKRGVEELVEVVFEVPVSLGKVAALEQEMSEALKPAYDEAVTAVREAPSKYVDETGWKKAGRKRWLWAAATSMVAVFLIHARRNLLALKTLLGETIVGFIHSDRWKVYNHIPTGQRQLCWAHLKRNFEKWLTRGKEGKAIGEAFLAIHRSVFEAWHLFRGGGCNREKLASLMVPLAVSLRELLSMMIDSGEEKLARLGNNLSLLEPAFWTFVFAEGVEPTNNHGERVQRLAVIWRKCCFGCHSESGCRFVERLLTVVQTLRLQKRSVLEFLTRTLQAHRTGNLLPKLVKAG
jgi:transposase